MAELTGIHSVHVRVAAVDGQPVSPADLERIAGKIADRTRAMTPARFATITTAADTGAVPTAAPDAAATDEIDARVLSTGIFQQPAGFRPHRRRSDTQQPASCEGQERRARGEVCLPRVLRPQLLGSSASSMSVMPQGPVPCSWITVSISV